MFNDYPFDPVLQAVRAAVRARRIVDVSYGNDVCPSYIAASDLERFNGDDGDAVRRLWIDDVDPRMREYDFDAPRLMICAGNGDASIYIGEFDAAQAIDALTSPTRDADRHDSRSVGPIPCAVCGDDVDEDLPASSTVCRACASTSTIGGRS